MISLREGFKKLREVNEKDWRLFRQKLPGWQEAYMDRLNREYVALLTGEGKASDKFWELEKRIRNDKRSVGVVAEMRRSMMYNNILSLIYDDVIGLDDLDDFSDELREQIKFVTRNRGTESD